MTRLMPLLAALTLTVESCAPSEPAPVELVVSRRYGLVVLDASPIDGGDLGGGWEWVSFSFKPGSPYAPRSPGDLGNGLIRQLEARGWSLACRNLNSLPVLGGPYDVIRVRRGSEGAGILIKPISPNGYRMEIGPAPASTRPFDCRPRED